MAASVRTWLAFTALAVLFVPATQAADTVPDAFSFASVTAATPGSVQTSAVAVVSGIDALADISVSGGSYSVDGGAYTTTKTKVGNGQAVAVQVQASTTLGATSKATLTIGGVKGYFSVTTAADTTPDAFAFASVNGAAAGSTQTSAAAVIGGINAPTDISISSGTYSVNGGAYTSAKTKVNNGDSVTVQVVASATSGATSKATLTVGGIKGYFSVITIADTTPDPFGFPSVSSVAPGSTQTSAAVAITGIDAPTDISLTSGSYSVNGSAFVSSKGKVNNGDMVQVQAVASSSQASTVKTVLTVGGVKGNFLVTTFGDTTPEAFNLSKLLVPEIGATESTDNFYVLPGTPHTSNAVTVSGIDTAVPISIAGGTYNVNGGAYTDAPGNVINGDVVTVQLSSAPAYASSSAAVTAAATLSIGGIASTFTLGNTLDPVLATPVSFSGAEAMVYRALSPVPLQAFVYKPAGWASGDTRPALLYFFGGGWTTGTAQASTSWASWATSLGMVAITPDYRTNQRFSTTPLVAVDDARAVLRWVQDNAGSLGIDASRIAVAGTSAGGHLSLWTALVANPPGSDPASAPLVPPAALALISAVSDTSPESGYTPQRFGPYASDLSPVNRLETTMPPVIAFHGDTDTTVPQSQTINLCNQLIAAGNVCQFVNVPGGDHNYVNSLPGWKEQTQNMMQRFFIDYGVLSP